MDIIIALFLGIVSAFIYSIIQQIILYFQWDRTRNYFISEIRNLVIKINYYVIDILRIDPIYDNGFEPDHLMTNKELVQKIQEININSEQFKKLNKALEYTSLKIRNIRKEALSVPTFTSHDFHLADRVINEIDWFISSYSWLSEEINKKDISNRFKHRLIDIIKIVEEKKYNISFLDKVIRWKKRIKYRKSIKFEKNLPF